MSNPFPECNGWVAEHEPQLRERLSAALCGAELDYAVNAIQRYETLAAENARLKLDYQVLEEVSPPDWPRADFVKHLYDLWSNLVEQDGKEKAAKESSLINHP